jgi:hypothetical protein
MLGLPEDHVEIRGLNEDDVPALIACVRRCYGESYTEPEFYDADHLRRELRAGRLLCVAAFVGERVVGHIGTRVPVAGDAIADTIAGIVDPDYRGMGLTVRIGAHMVAGYAELGIVGTRHLATGAHIRTQRPIVSSGGVATGVLLGHVPVGTDYRGIEHRFAVARIGVVVYFQSYHHGRLGALDVFLPDRYADRVTDLYERLAIERRHLPTGPSRPWVGSAHHDALRGISSLRFGVLAGADAPAAIDLIDKELPRCQPVAYADVPIADPRAPELIDLLHARGFFFGALLPGTAVSEAIRLQRLTNAPIAPDAIATASPEGRTLLEWIGELYESSRGHRD